jgi:hypothetical protein
VKPKNITLYRVKPVFRIQFHYTLFRYRCIVPGLFTACSIGNLSAKTSLPYLAGTKMAQSYLEIVVLGFKVNVLLPDSRSFLVSV